MVTIPRPKYNRLLKLYGIWLRETHSLESEKLRARLLESFSYLENEYLVPSIDNWASCLPPDVYLKVDFGHRESVWHAIVSWNVAGTAESVRAFDAFLLAILKMVELTMKAEGFPSE